MPATLLIFFAVKGDDLMPPTPDWYPWFAAINWVTGVALLFSLFAVISAIRIWLAAAHALDHAGQVHAGGAGLRGAELVAVHCHLIGPARRI